MRLVPAEPLLAPGLLLRSFTAGAYSPPADVRLFAYGRDALSAYAVAQPADAQFLVPAYICVEATAPVQATGRNVVYYPVSRSLEPDWAWLRGHAPGPDTSFLLVHYFGFPNALDEAQSLCKERGWHLVEDCAHSFLSKYRGTVVGTTGDAAIHSYRKLLPIPDGGALRMAGATELDLSQASMGVLRQALRKVAKSLIYRVGLPSKLWERMQRLLGAPGAPVSDDSVPRRMSQVSRRLMAVLGPRFDTLVEKRRHNYAFLAEGMSKHDEVELLFPSLPDGVCPQVLPLLVGDQERVRVGLKAHGIPAGTWPDLPKDLPNNGVAAIGNEIASSLITLPVHQDLSENDLHHILDAYQGIRV